MKKVIIILSVISLLVAFPFSVGRNPKKNYLDCDKKITKAINNDEVDTAEDILKEYSEEFGMNDAMLFLEAKVLLANEGYGEALALLEQIQDKNSYNYYLLKTKVYSLAGENYRQELGNFCASFARKHPDNPEYQFNAGMSLMSSGKYAKSLYFFDRAAGLMVFDGTADYFCGVLAYEMGDKASSLEYFVNAKKKGVSREIEDSIMQFADKEVNNDK